jgi:hypothetical protein
MAAIPPEEHLCADACCKVSLLATKLEGGSPKNTNTPPRRRTMALHLRCYAERKILGSSGGGGELRAF